MAAESTSINLNRYALLPSKYQKEYPIGARIKGSIVFAVAAVGITALITALALAFSGHLNTFPQDFVRAFTHVNSATLMIGIGASIILVGGTYWVIQRARSKEDRYVQNRIFLSSNYEDHIEEAIFERTNDKKIYTSPAYIDKSTLKNGNGKAYLYAVKDCENHYMVSTLVPLATPVRTICSIVYHAIRTVIVPFWVLGSYAIETCINRPVFLGKRERYKPVDIVLEPWKSLKHVLTDPFYGLAFMAAAIYSLANPMGGRILAAKIERDWNDGATRPEGIWLIETQRLWHFGNLDLNVFLAGCWQPIGVVKYHDGKIIPGSGKSMSRAVQKDNGHVYEVFSRTELSKNLVIA